MQLIKAENIFMLNFWFQSVVHFVNSLCIAFKFCKWTSTMTQGWLLDTFTTVRATESCSGWTVQWCIY